MYKEYLLITTIPILFSAIILNAIFYVFLEGSQYSHTFEGTLINQTYLQDVKGDYIVYQNFTIEPLVLMQCNSHSRILTLNYIPKIEEVYYLDLTVNCQGVNLFDTKTIGIITLTMLLYSIIIIACFSNNPENKLNRACIVSFNSCLYTIICLINFTAAIKYYLYKKRYITGYPASSDIISKHTFINAEFAYCHEIVANITNGIINCYNKSYIGECYRTYEEALINDSNGDVYLTEKCGIFYDASIWPEYIIFLSFTGILFVLMLIMAIRVIVKYSD